MKLLESEPLHTYEEIAQALGMSRSGVRAMEQRALRKLKKALTAKGLQFDDLLPTQGEHFEREIDSQ